MDVTILTWNVRGVSGKGVCRFIRESVSENRVNILCLQETLCDSWNVKLKNAIWDMDQHGQLIQNSKGHSGGLTISWELDSFIGVGLAQDDGWLWVQLECISNKERINVVNVYAPQNSKRKKDLWDQLSQLKNLAEHEPICFAGDFNCIRWDNEIANCLYRRKDAVFF